MEPLAKLAVSKSKNERDAVVHNYAHEHELNHIVRTLDTIRMKECRCIDFEQRKFLQSLSLTPEDLEEPSSSPGKSPNGTSVRLGISSDDSVAQLYHTAGAYGRKELLGVNDKDLPRSLSDMDIRRANTEGKPRSYRGRSKTFSSGEAGASTTFDGSSEPSDPYSISCSMKVSESKGSFEASTGKHGLSAWMGKKRLSHNPVRKFVY